MASIAKELAEATARIAALQGQIDESLKATAEMSDTIKAKDSEIADLKDANTKQVQEDQKALESVKADLAAKEAELETAKRTMIEQGETLTKQLNAAVGELAKARAALKQPAFADAGARGEAEPATEISQSEMNHEEILEKLKGLKGKDKTKFYREHKKEIEDAQAALRESRKAGA